MPEGVDGRDDLWILLEVLRRAYPDRALKVGYGAEQSTPKGFAHYKERIDGKMLEKCLAGWSAKEPEVAARVGRELGAQGFCVLGAKRYDELPYTKPFDTPSGKIEVYALRAVLNPALRKAKADPLPDWRPIPGYKLPVKGDEFFVLSGKSMSNGSGTAAWAITGLAVGDRSVWMNPEDGRRLDIADGEAIELEGLDTGQKGVARVRLTKNVRPGVLFTYAFSGGYRSSALAKDARFAFMREGINPNRIGPGKVEPVTGAIANNFSARVRKA
jgi:anaerobic selenocysteine-containing dehydrogenase